MAQRGEKKQIYAAHLSQREAIEGKNAGRLMTGIVRVSAGRSDRAFISHKLKYVDLARLGGDESGSFVDNNEDAPDVMIPDRISRNRALQGDEVCLKIRHPDQWVQKVDKYTTPDGGLDLQEEGSSGGEGILQAIADVVYIISNQRGRSFVCTLQRNSNASPQPSPSEIDAKQVDGAPPKATPPPELILSRTETFVRAVPIDRRFPWILIRVQNLLKFFKIPAKDQTFRCPAASYFRVQIQQWSGTASLPMGEVLSYVGDVGFYEAEEEAALSQAGLTTHLEDLPQDAMDEAEKIVTANYEHIQNESKIRLDLRKELVVTIDPITARDFDDAIHIKEKPLGADGKRRWEVGVHIADVAHYVKPGSAIDEEAKWRTTSLYMPLRAIPMLPRPLCDGLCSLRPNEEKLTFSIILEIDEEGNITDKRFAKTVINSFFRFTYEDVDDLLKTQYKDDVGRLTCREAYDLGIAKCMPMEEILQASKDRYKALTGEEMATSQCRLSRSQWMQICGQLKLLECLTQKMRRRRFENGSVALLKSDVKTEFTDQAPTGLSFEASSTSHELIEELMLLANVTVAETLRNDEEYSQYAVLRRHPPPDTKELVKFLAGIGVPHDLSSSYGVMRTVQHLAKHFDHVLAFSFTFMLLNVLAQAEYFVLNDESKSSHHYALAFSNYTHFTSPIRRYADLMVHRLLSATLRLKDGLAVTDGELASSMAKDENQLVCDQINEIRLKARDASQYCQLAMFAVYLRSLPKLMTLLGVVLMVHDRSVVVYIPKLGVKKRVYFDSETSERKFTDDKPIQRRDLLQVVLPKSFKQVNKNEAKADWFNKETGKSIEKIYNPFSTIPIALIPTTTAPVELILVPVAPWQKGYSEAFRTEDSEEQRFAFKASTVDDLDVDEVLRLIRGQPNASAAR